MTCGLILLTKSRVAATPTSVPGITQQTPRQVDIGYLGHNVFGSMMAPFAVQQCVADAHGGVASHGGGNRHRD